MSPGENAGHAGVARGIGLVLGAGGPVGHAFHAGVLAALEETTGWDPRRASLVVGTSAGAEVAALLRAGLGATDLCARIEGRPLRPEAADAAACYLRPDHGPFPWHLSWPLARTAPAWLAARLRRRQSAAAMPGRRSGHEPGPWMEALLPLGRVDLRHQAEAFSRMFPGGWPARPLWLVAGRLDDGQRVVFGRGDAPSTDVGRAVAASGAVPGINPPVTIDGRPYIDGGLRSTTNLDVLAEPAGNPPPPQVVVLAPLSCAPRRAPRSWLRPARLVFGRRLEAEARAVGASGTKVHLFHPEGTVLRAMGVNPFSVARMQQVARAARRATLLALRSGRGALASLLVILSNEASSSGG